MANCLDSQYRAEFKGDWYLCFAEFYGELKPNMREALLA